MTPPQRPLEGLRPRADTLVSVLPFAAPGWLIFGGLAASPLQGYAARNPRRTGQSGRAR